MSSTGLFTRVIRFAPPMTGALHAARLLARVMRKTFQASLSAMPNHRANSDTMVVVSLRQAIEQIVMDGVELRHWTFNLDVGLRFAPLEHLQLPLVASRIVLILATSTRPDSRPATTSAHADASSPRIALAMMSTSTGVNVIPTQTPEPAPTLVVAAALPSHSSP